MLGFVLSEEESGLQTQLHVTTTRLPLLPHRPLPRIEMTQNGHQHNVVETFFTWGPYKPQQLTNLSAVEANIMFCQVPFDLRTIDMRGPDNRSHDSYSLLSPARGWMLVK